MENSTLPLITVALLSALVECMVTHTIVYVDKVMNRELRYIYNCIISMKSFLLYYRKCILL